MRFDVCAHSYDEHAGPQRFFAERVAQFIGAKPHHVVVELGAGTGALTFWLVEALSAVSDQSIKPPGRVEKRLGLPMYATDASPKMVEVGRRAVPQARWLVADAFDEWIPLAEIQVSSGLLQWSEDPVSTLVRWKQRVHPKGRMVHAMPCEPCLTEWRALVPESPVPWRNEAEWLKIFERAGLRVACSQRWTHNAICGSALEMVRGFHRTGVTGRVRVGPARLRQALREYDVRHRVVGGVQATWAWLAVEAA
jgi:SAM-dependent methyltransferase